MKIAFGARVAAWLLVIALTAQGLVVPTYVGAAQTAPNTNITNQATATYKDAAGTVYNTTSNIVTTVVQNAPTLTETTTSANQYSPGQVVTDTFTITNQGNASGTIQVNGSGTQSGTGAFTTANTDVSITGTYGPEGTLGGGPAVSGCTGSGAALYSVTIGATTTYCPSIAALNTFLGTQTIAAGASITVNDYYTVAAGSPSGSPTIDTELYSIITYATVGSAAAETSAVANATTNNTVIADATVNQYKTASQCTVSPCTGNTPVLPANDAVGDIQYTISANNSGAQPAKDLKSVAALVGSSIMTTACGACTGGVLLTDKLPLCTTCAGTPVMALSNATGGNATVSVTVSSGKGFANSAKAFVVYSTSATAATWALGTGSGVTTGTGTFTVPTGSTVYYLGVLIVSGTAGGACTTAGELCPGTSTTNGNANVATNAALQLVFSVKPSTLPGSGNAGAYNNATTFAWGDNQNTPHIDCPGVPALTADSASATQLTTGTQCINTPVVTNCPEVGCSNLQINTAIAAYSVLNGPFDGTESGTCAFASATACYGADAQGSYDGAVTSDNTSDFTAIPFDTPADTVNNTSVTAGSPTVLATNKTSAAFTSSCIQHSVFNYGNINDTFNLAASAVTQSAIPNTGAGAATTGWTVGLYSNPGCSASTTSLAVTSGQVAYYYVKYTAASGQPYLDRFDVTITATSAGDGSKTNTTHDELYSSFIALTKSANVTATGCPTGAVPSLPTSDATGAKVCPGGTIQYTVDYRNLVMGTSSTLVSFAQAITSAASVVVSDDGTKATVSSTTLPNWYAFTGGLTGAPIDKDSNGVARSGANASTFAYYTGSPAGSPTGTVPTSGAPASKYDDTVGGSTFRLAPKGAFAAGLLGALPVSEPAASDWQGTVTFTLTVK